MGELLDDLAVAQSAIFRDSRWLAEKTEIYTERKPRRQEQKDYRSRPGTPSERGRRWRRLLRI